MRVVVLFDIHRQLQPDETFSMKELRKEEAKATEADVITALRALGHEVEQLPVYDDVGLMFERLTKFAPDVVFNLCETFFLDRAHEPNVPALLDLMKLRYTGASPHGLLLCHDKPLATKVLAFHRIRASVCVAPPRSPPLRPEAL